MIFELALDAAQIIFADIVLSGDNAIIIGMAAAGLPPELRKKAIFFGMAAAAGLRIVFTLMAGFLTTIPGILFFGGLLLVWVCWRFYHELRAQSSGEHREVKTFEGTPKQQLRRALITITVADVSMSIDNVLAVVAIARDNFWLLIFGLLLAIAFMAFFATTIVKILKRFPWLSWAGLAFLVYLSLRMLHDGWPEVALLLGFGGGP